ncbi:3-hydroxyisobutyryl-CoA hydrolase-like protein 5 [Ananas comosus]|uniref:3-hydroxyisobutyryl-CoA hydrolase n=1 Tax=Ananas comosus TaxID=4615 RepID=A0A6P5FUG5_ANACO|nr:3-hydroxyisobutyryl-CoA hydrolase-like protein 5 [Ananas comosus]XP_020099306.1 3-hydroxyisobutyryl-CoA hydrolase-like protein 5 [Ananas comosus]XP_020099307.1 3-hydroxyisobutyryl-CoA hydrolase-like protein 5 [Ananas comosus]
MAREQLSPEEVVMGEEVNNVRLITLNRPRQLNVISSKVVYLVAQFLEKWEKDDDAELIIFKGAGRAFCAGGDLKMFYEGRSDDSCLEVVYRMYWLCYHIHTYKKTAVALAHGIVMGGGGAMVVPLKFSVVTEKTVFALPEAGVGLHTDCSFSYILSRLPGHLGEYLALTGARLNGKEMVAAGLATHFVPSDRLHELEQRLVSLDSGDAPTVRAVIEEFSLDVRPEEESILNKLSTIDKCFCGESVEEIIKLFEAEASIEGNGWIAPVLKGLKRSSPTGLKIILRSIREGRKQSLPECLKKEFRLTMNILRSVISGDVYEGIRAISIDKDNAPKWNPPTLKEVSDENIDRIFKPFSAELELPIPSDEEESCRWDGKYENSVYSKAKETQ